MSWLNPREIPHSGYNPQERVDSFINQYGEKGKSVLNIFDTVDPLEVLFDENVDEYLGYARRFLNKLGNRELENLTRDEIRELVVGSFHEGQIGKFASEEKIEKLINYFDSLKGPLK